MSCCVDLADYGWLTGDDAAAVLRDLAGGSEPLHTRAARLRREFSPARTHLLLEQVELRRRAATKFPLADRMFFTRTLLEQATDRWVAAHKAARFIGRGAVADLCCGIGGDLLALASVAEVVGVDSSPAAACLAAANVRAVLGPDGAAGATVHSADAGRFDIAHVGAWHLDPDRRAAGRRTTSLDRCTSNRAIMDRLLGEVPHAAVKLAPATRVPSDWADQCELEWIGRDRQCRQLVAWHGELAEAPGRRQATVLSGGSVRSVLGQPDQAMPVADRLDRYVYEPDPAVLAARLTGTLAAQHGLAATSFGPAYLTGSTTVTDPALACFEVQEIYPLRLRVVARHLRERGIGRLEIKTRGVELEPEQVRRELALRGDGVATLILTQVAGRRSAILAQRVVSPAPVATLRGDGRLACR